jgi:hypothetical protein
MGFAALVALVGLIFGMISIKLMSIAENTQIVVLKGVRETNRFRRESLNRARSKKIVASVKSTPKLFLLQLGIAFFARISSLIFIAEAMYPEKVVEGAALAMMKTVVISNRIRVLTVRSGKHAIQKVKMRKTINHEQGAEKTSLK